VPQQRSSGPCGIFVGRKQRSHRESEALEKGKGREEKRKERGEESERRREGREGRRARGEERGEESERKERREGDM
jgi:hypothetical protein